MLRVSPCSQCACRGLGWTGRPSPHTRVGHGHPEAINLTNILSNPSWMTAAVPCTRNKNFLNIHFIDLRLLECELGSEKKVGFSFRNVNEQVNKTMTISALVKPTLYIMVKFCPVVGSSEFSTKFGNSELCEILSTACN